MIVYIDGIFDLFHFGHIESFRKCKELYPNTTLIVGVIGDNSAKEYKREPIINEKHRYALVENSKYVDKIIRDPPLVITKDFMENNNIDVVVHSFSNTKDRNNQDDFFSYPKSIQAFKEINYCNEINTTYIIDRIFKNIELK
tara:strand:+ start:109 stop:534 length:426 start_codon:yes stop_codon:yes gene_type:complete